jgi:hypothetical protein
MQGRREKGRGKREEEEENPCGSHINVSLHFFPLGIV